MNINSMKATQTDHPAEGRLRLQVLAADRNQPIEDASVTISYSGDRILS